MTNGILIFAHNNREVDYGLLAVISGGLAKKHLHLPVSLVTDLSTKEWLIKSRTWQQVETVFEHVIIVDKPVTNNQRGLHDGVINKKIPFCNTNRHSVWDLTPYDRTLLIDSDFLIFSDNLNKYWNVEADVMIGDSINDIYSKDRLGYLDRYVCETSCKMYWATTVMFTKNPQSKLFFDTVNLIKENYKHYADVFQFDHRQYRNDIAFSVAKHMLDGFENMHTPTLPPVLSVMDKDILTAVDKNKLTFLIDHRLDATYCAASVTGVDIHVMNKQSILRHQQQLMELI